MDAIKTINKSRTQVWAKMGLFLMVAIMGLVQACGTSRIPEGARIIEDTPTKNIPTNTPYVTPTVPEASILTATASALQTHTGAVRFMGYTVGNGALDKLPQVISILQAYNADVLSIQEANGWLVNDFEIAGQVAEELGMEYIYCQADEASVDKNGNTYDLVLFSKLEIKSFETFSNVSNCLIRAEVITPGGQSVQVFAADVKPDFDEVGCRNVENIASAIKSYANDSAILLGDMMMPPPGVVMGYSQNQIECPPLLVDAGFSFFSDVSKLDHVWVTQAMLDLQSYKLPNPSTEPLVPKNVVRNLSDHSPLAVDFYFP
jgi:hypothetical protein